MAADFGLLNAQYSLGWYCCRRLMLTTAVTLAVLLVGSAALADPCTGPGAPTTTQTRCLTAVQIPGKPLGEIDVSWVDPGRAEYYLADRSNAGIDVIDTRNLTFKRTIPGFVGAIINKSTGKINMGHSGPNGVASHGRWLYAGDGDSTLHVIDLNAATAITRITVDGTIIPAGVGLGIKSPTWEPLTKRFYMSIPTIANNPMGCN